MGGSDAERRRPGAPVDAYLAELAARAGAVLDGRLVGVYAGGSLALGAYERGRSDLDVAVVVEGRLSRATKEELVDALRHESLPCPARGLELVVYSPEAAGAATVGADFELNLNTGRELTFRADFEPGAVEEHWFAIDRAILGRHGVPIVGPPAADAFAPIPRDLLLPVVAASLRWHERGEALGDDAVLNACRGLRYAVDDEWSSKPAAGRWALVEGVGDAAAITAALEARGGGPPVDADRAARFVAFALEEIESTPI